jgi:cytochrome b561
MEPPHLMGDPASGPRRSLAWRRRILRVRRHLHWWTAVLVTIGFALAWIMTSLPVTELLIKFLLYQLHKSLGLCVSGLAALRLFLAWRTCDTPRGLQAVLYALLLIVPLLGYLTAAASPTTVPTLFFLLFRVPHVIAPDQAVFDAIRPLHKWLAIGLVGLAVWHAVRMRARASGLAALRMARSGHAHPPAERR